MSRRTALSGAGNIRAGGTLALVMLLACGVRAQSDSATTTLSVERWLLQARSSDRSTRERASDALVALGPESVPGLSALASDDTMADDVRLHAINTLQSLAAQNDAALVVLVRLALTSEGSFRRRATSALGRIGERSLPLLVAELSNPKLRNVALKALGSMGPAAVPTAPSILPLLADPEVRERAARTLGRMGEKAAPVVAGALKSQRLRLGAVDTLGEMGAKARSQSAALLATLDDPDSGVRLHAVKAVASVLPEATIAVPALGDRLIDPDNNVRAAAAFALSRYGEDARLARTALVAALDDDSKDVRKEVVLTLRAIADMSLVDELARAANDVAGGVANAAVRALQELGPQASQKLVATLANRNSSIDARGAAAGALGRMAENPKLAPAGALPALSAALRDDSERVRRAAGVALGRIGAPTVTVLAEALDDERRAVRLVALGSLWDIGQASVPVVPDIARLLKDSDRDVRLAAMDVLAGLGSDARSAVPSLIVVLKDDETWFRPWWRSASSVVRPTDVKLAAAAAHVLGAIGRGAGEAAPELARALSDEDPHVRSESADALRRIGVRDRDVLDRLRIASDDDDSEVRRNARRALTELGG